MLPLVVSGTLACVVVGKLAEMRGNYKSSCIVGSVFQILGASLFTSITAETRLWKIYIFEIILGIGAGGLTAIGNTIALHNIAKDQFARPVTWINWILLLAAATGVAMQGALFNHQISSAVDMIKKLHPEFASLSLGFNVLLEYLHTADDVDPILLLGRKYATFAQRDASCLYLAIGILSFFASLFLPDENLFH